MVHVLLNFFLNIFLCYIFLLRVKLSVWKYSDCITERIIFQSLSSSSVDYRFAPMRQFLFAILFLYSSRCITIPIRIR